jgi:hypothetical protein
MQNPAVADHNDVGNADEGDRQFKGGQRVRAVSMAYATLVYGGQDTDGFIRGTLTLAQSLRLANASAPLVVMLANIEDTRQLKRLYDFGCVDLTNEASRVTAIRMNKPFAAVYWISHFISSLFCSMLSRRHNSKWRNAC